MNSKLVVQTSVDGKSFCVDGEIQRSTGPRTMDQQTQPYICFDTVHTFRDLAFWCQKWDWACRRQGEGRSLKGRRPPMLTRPLLWLGPKSLRHVDQSLCIVWYRWGDERATVLQIVPICPTLAQQLILSWNPPFYPIRFPSRPCWGCSPPPREPYLHVLRQPGPTIWQN